MTQSRNPLKAIDSTAYAGATASSAAQVLGGGGPNSKKPDPNNANADKMSAVQTVTQGDGRVVSVKGDWGLVVDENNKTNSIQADAAQQQFGNEGEEIRMPAISMRI